MSEFERIYQSDPVQEADYERESKSIELSDGMIAQGWIYREPSKEVINSYEFLIQKLKLQEDIKILQEEPTTKGIDEKSKSKSFKGKPKKIHTKPNKSTMAGI